MTSNTALNFASTNGLKAGQDYSIVDTTTLTAIFSERRPALNIHNHGITHGITPTTVTMSANAAGSGVESGNKITFTPIANPAVAAQLYEPTRDAFLYAVASCRHLKDD